MISGRLRPRKSNLSFFAWANYWTEVPQSSVRYDLFIRDIWLGVLLDVFEVWR